MLSLSLISLFKFFSMQMLFAGNRKQEFLRENGNVCTCIMFQFSLCILCLFRCANVCAENFSSLRSHVCFTICVCFRRFAVRLDVQEGAECMEAPACPPQGSGVSQGSAVGLWCLAGNVESADGKTWRKKAEGKRGKRCVVALIWSAVLVSANQGLPVQRGAWVHHPPLWHHTPTPYTKRHKHPHHQKIWKTPAGCSHAYSTLVALALASYLTVVNTRSVHLCLTVSGPLLWPSIPLCLFGSLWSVAGHKISWKELQVAESGAFSTLGVTYHMLESRETTAKSSSSLGKALVLTWTLRGCELQLECRGTGSQDRDLKEAG